MALKNQIVNIFGFVGNTFATTQLYHGREKAAVEAMNKLAKTVRSFRNQFFRNSGI